MSVAAELKPFFFDEQESAALDLQIDPDQFRPVTPYSDDLDDEYQAAQEKLRELRQQEEQIKRQAAELEELTKKEQLFKTGRAEVCDELKRLLSLLEREAAEAQRIVEDCDSAQERLEAHLAKIRSVRPESWGRADRKTELTRALSQIEAAEDEIDGIQALIEGFGKKGGLFGGKLASPVRISSSSEKGDFAYWLKSGFAFSLPFVGFGALALLWFLLA